MTEPIELPSHDELDELVDTDPIRLRNVAYGLRAEVERLRAEVESLKARLSSAESVMRQALADPVHETRTHLLGLYLAAAQSAQDGDGDA
jgi:uncharacterized protein YlxW (UPF0749 family)